MGRDQKLHGNIAAAISNAAPVVRDMVGRVLEPGDEVLVTSAVHTYRVIKIEPVRGPGAPPNLMRLQLVNVINLPCPREEPLSGIVRIRTAQEMREAGELEVPRREAGTPDGEPEKATTVTLE